MKILITGATGFIGSRLALMTREAGHEVVATGQLNNELETSRSKALARHGMQVVVGSLQNTAFVASLVRGCDAVIHLAAAQHEANVPDEYFHHVNVDATRALVEAAIAAGVVRLVYGSTIGIYGSASDGYLDEESPPRPENIYGTTKLEAERLVRMYGMQLNVVIIRISETYGPGDFRLLKLFHAVNHGHFALIGPCDNLHQVIHVDDLSRGLLLGATHPDAIGETFLLAGPEVMTTRDLVRHVAAALGRPMPRTKLPLLPFALAAAVLETTFKPLGIQPPLHRRRLDFFRKSFLFSTDKAQKRLGFVPAVTFAEGAAQTARWYAEQGLICPEERSTGLPRQLSS